MACHRAIRTNVLVRAILSVAILIIPTMAGAIVGKLTPLWFRLRLRLILALFMALRLVILAVVLYPGPMFLTN